MDNHSQEIALLEKKVLSKIDDNSTHVQEQLAKFENITMNLDDHIVSFNGMRPKFMHSEQENQVRIILPKTETSEGLDMGMHEHAILQFGSKLKIPTGYLKQKANGVGWEKSLTAHILTEHMKHADQSRMLFRSVEDELRGVLSDKYRRLNSQQILGTFIRLVTALGAKIIDAYVSDTRNWFEVVMPQVIEIPTQRNGTVVIVFGMRCANSDFGDGALDLRAFQMQVKCLNGWVQESLLRQVHLGARLTDDINYSNKTYELDTRTMESATEDIIQNVFTPEAIQRKAELIQDASAKEINMKTEISKLQRLGTNKAEQELVEKKILESNPDDGVEGESSLWKLTQAVGAVANESNDRRKRELHEVAGKLMERVNANQ